MSRFYGRYDNACKRHLKLIIKNKFSKIEGNRMGCTATKQKVKIGSKKPICTGSSDEMMIEFEKQLDERRENRELRDILGKFRQIRAGLVVGSSSSTDCECQH